MSDGSLITRAMLPAYFTLRGLPFRRTLDALERSQHWPPERLRDLVRERLSRLLVSAAATSFHAARFRAAGFAPGDLRAPEDLAGLPPLEKTDLGALLASVDASGPRWERRTAGTSGRPATVLASRDAQAAALAARYRGYRWYGLEAGDREARFWGRPVVSPTLGSRLRNLVLNRVVLDHRHVEADAIADTHTRLCRARVRYIYGYASLVLRFARRCERLGLAPPPSLTAVVLTAEGSRPAERAWLGEVLDCAVTDEYGCSEVDVIAFTCPEGGRHLMAENILVESVPIPGRPDAHELLLTDLHNTLMPLIRYRIGDVGRLSDAICPCGRTLPLLADLEGRGQAQSILTPAGERVHASGFAYFMEREQDAGVPIRQFRIEQADPGSLIATLVMDGDVPARDALGARLEAFVAERCGGLRLDLRWADEIRPEPGRKFEYFVSRLSEEECP